MIGRRKFLKVLGITPLAAKASAEKAAAEISLRSWGAAPLAEAVDNDALHRGIPVSRDADAEPYTKMKNYLRLMGKFPDHVDEQIRRESMRVDHIDPDIAVKKSWSFAVKIQAQRQRNYDQRVQSIMTSGGWVEAQKAFAKIAGFEWRW